MNDLLRRFSPWPVLILGGVVGLSGLGVVGYLLDQWPVSPERDLRPYFLVAVWLAASGLSLPLVWFLHRRFGKPSMGDNWRSLGVLARQASWAGIWATACAWFQMNRSLNWAMALLLLVVIALFEGILLMRQERP